MWLLWLFLTTFTPGIQFCCLSGNVIQNMTLDHRALHTHQVLTSLLFILIRSALRWGSQQLNDREAHMSTNAMHFTSREAKLTLLAIVLAWLHSWSRDPHLVCCSGPLRFSRCDAAVRAGTCISFAQERLISSFLLNPVPYTFHLHSNNLFS